MRMTQVDMSVHLAFGIPEICVQTQVPHVRIWQQQGSLEKARSDGVSNCLDTSMLFLRTFVVPVRVGGYVTFGHAS
jgi:hypothetical protein